jgi:hypothetical protein
MGEPIGEGAGLGDQVFGYLGAQFCGELVRRGEDAVVDGELTALPIRGSA